MVETIPHPTASTPHPVPAPQGSPQGSLYPAKQDSHRVSCACTAGCRLRPLSPLCCKRGFPRSPYGATGVPLSSEKGSRTCAVGPKGYSDLFGIDRTNVRRKADLSQRYKANELCIGDRRAIVGKFNLQFKSPTPIASQRRVNNLKEIGMVLTSNQRPYRTLHV